MFENIKGDIARLSPHGTVSLRIFIAGILSQGFQAILVYRFFNWCHRKGLPGQPLRYILERFIEITTGISIPATCKIGKGFRIYHFGGIMFHPTVIMGKNCTIYHDVTIGDKDGSGGAARIADNVMIGAGAKIIGEINIGNHCVIGTNAVVTKDMPDNTVAVGNPCQIRKKKLAENEDKQKKSIKIMDLRGTYKGGGGPDKTILNSGNMHHKGRVDILVTYLRDPKDEEFNIHLRATELNINYIDVWDRKLVDLQCVSDLNQLIKEYQIILIHAHDDKTLLYCWLLKLRNRNLHLMYTCHSHSCYQRADFDSVVAYLKYMIRKKIQIFLMKRFKKPILTISDDTKKRLVGNGLPENVVEVIHNGIDVNYWIKGAGRPVLRDELGLSENAFVVGTVARITYDKDLPTFYKVAGNVAKEIPNTFFIIVGDGYGDELERARGEVKRLGLERVIKFMGHRTDMLDIYAAFDIFLMTSLTEGLPNTALEAMSMSIPIVSTSVGGVPELIVDGETGFLSEKGDVKGLSKNVVTLLKDESLREQFSSAARRRIEDEFNFSRRVALMEDYYEQFVND